MEIKGFINISLVDWDGKVSSVIFLPNCNMRCPFCYNTTLVLQPDKLPTIPFEHIEKSLQKNRGWIDGVVVTGGEPTIHDDLPALCEKMKALDFSIKLDTNGTNPNMIKELIDKRLVDYVALDVKGPLTQEKYSRAVGVDANLLLRKIEETIDILLRGEVEYEFRTTVVPTLHENRDIEEICRRIRGCRKYVIQNFKSDVEIIDPRFKNLKPFSKVEMNAFFVIAKTLVPNTILRG